MRKRGAVRQFAKGTILGLAGFLAAWGCGRQVEPETTSALIVDGLKVVYQRVPESDHVAVGFFLMGGINYAGELQAGLEPLLLRVAMQGTHNWPHHDMQSRLEYMGMTLEPLVNYDYTGLAAQFPLDELDPAWNLFRDILLYPRLAPEDLERVRGQVLGELAAVEDRPDRQAVKLANDLFYDGHAYSLSLSGTAPMIGRLTRNELLQYHMGDVTRNRALLVVVGDLDSKEITARVRDLAQRIPRGPEVRLPAVVFNPGNTDLTIERRNIPVHTIVGLFPGPQPGHPEYPAFCVAVELLNGQLQDALKLSTPLSPDVSAATGRRMTNHGLIQLTTDQPAEAIATVLATVQELVARPVTDEDLSAAKAVATTRYLMGGVTAMDQLERLAMWELAGTGWVHANQFVEEIVGLRQSHLQPVFRKYFRGLHFSVVGPRRTISRDILSNR